MKKTEFVYEATLIRVIDGDTFELQVDLGLEVRVNSRFRLLGVDTPEIYGVKHGSDEWQRGQEASQYVKDWFKQCEGKVVLRTHKPGSDLSKGKYGRWLVEVYANNDSDDLALNEMLVVEKLVK